MTNHVYRQSELDEVLGLLHSINITEIGLVALIGNVSVLLPEELAEQLSDMVGKRVGILRLDGRYHIRCLDGEREPNER